MREGGTEKGTCFSGLPGARSTLLKKKEEEKKLTKDRNEDDEPPNTRAKSH